MNKRRIAALQAGLLFVTVFANAASKIAITMRIKVLSSESQTVVLDDSGVPKNCDGLNFDAYCHSSQAAQVTNTLLVQEEDGAPFRVACAVDSRWSRCTLLPQGESFDARKEKHGITVYYQDDNGKLRKQSYALVAPDAKANPVAAAAPVATNPGPAPAAAAVPRIPPQTVKCSFTSTPAGAEVTVDGRFAGSTPSVLALGAGNHVVVVSMRGCAQWKRDLAVSSGSELTVNAILQKVP